MCNYNINKPQGYLDSQYAERFLGVRRVMKLRFLAAQYVMVGQQGEVLWNGVRIDSRDYLFMDCSFTCTVMKAFLPGFSWTTWDRHFSWAVAELNGSTLQMGVYWSEEVSPRNSGTHYRDHYFEGWKPSRE
ncbi:hypothetical protein LINPERHAP1_LOCUS5781 [Linum perenne]